MSETTESTNVNARSASTPESDRSSTGGQSFRVGDKIIRIDAASIDLPGGGPKTPQKAWERVAARQDAEASGVATVVPQPLESYETIAAAPTWEAAPGMVEMGLGYIVENNLALQEQAATDVAGTVTTSPAPTGPLRIKPAWEVDYFRWPRLARRLLKSHRSLFDQIGSSVFSSMDATRRRIGVCSTFQREGKSTIAICLARWAALAGKHVLLIDADVERPKMTTICGIDRIFGWQAILDADLPASETMIRSVESGLVFMPSRTDKTPLIVNKSLDQLGTITFQMKYEFDLVIVDMGTIDNICAHGTEAMDVIDAMVVTRDPSRTSVGQTMDTRTVLKNMGIEQSWVARNFARRDVA